MLTRLTKLHHEVVAGFQTVTYTWKKQQGVEIQRSVTGFKIGNREIPFIVNSDKKKPSKGVQIALLDVRHLLCRRGTRRLGDETLQHAEVLKHERLVNFLLEQFHTDGHNDFMLTSYNKANKCQVQFNLGSWIKPRQQQRIVVLTFGGS